MKELVIYILLLPFPLSIDFISQVVMWNVGQGQFLTLTHPHACYHIDFGGEFFPREVSSLCKHQKNILYYSHEDKDHINFAKNFQRKLPRICLYKKSHHKYLRTLQLCKDLSPIKILFETQSLKNNNSNSTIFTFNNKFLFTGDSTRAAEKIWSYKIPSSIQYWTVPHHGSKTSSSSNFLKYIPSNSIALISARKNKYGHPHKEVLNRLKIKKIPALKTQDWGHIRILINSRSFPSP